VRQPTPPCWPACASCTHQRRDRTREPPMPEDRPDFAPSWASDQLLAMETVVRSFPPGSASGPYGLWPQNLLDCHNCADSAAKEGLLEALLTLVTKTSSGRLHPLAAPYLCAARLIPLRKIGGVRPIAVGDTLRRLVAKWLLATTRGRNAATARAPLQTAFAKVSSFEARPWECRPRLTPCTGARGGSCCGWT